MRLAPLCLLLCACASTAPLPPGEKIGEPLEPREIVHYAVVGADPSAYFDRILLVEADVLAVCQSKGCWMLIEDGGGVAMVRWFTECGGKYAFPKDLAGKRVLIQGNCYPRKLTADDVAHYSQEAGRELDIPLDGYEINASAIVVLD